MAVFVIVAAVALAGFVSDGVDRWGVQHGRLGLEGTLQMEGEVSHNVGKPPPVKQVVGTFTSDDSTVVGRGTLAERAPRHASPGAMLRVRWLPSDPDEVYLASGSRAFTSWLEGMALLVVGFAALGGIALWLRARARRATDAPAAP